MNLIVMQFTTEHFIINQHEPTFYTGAKNQSCRKEKLRVPADFKFHQVK